MLVIPNAVDPANFSAGEKRRLVLTNGLEAGSEKNPEDTAAIAQLLHTRAARGHTGPFDLVALEGLDHGRVRELLTEARVLLFLSTHEGLPLLPLEAQLSGTLVLGIRRSPMTECIPARCLFDFGDLEGLVRATESALDEPEAWEAEIAAGMGIARRLFAGHEASVLEAWLEIAPRLRGSA